MGKLQKFTRKEGTTVVALQLNLDTEGFEYEKWGAVQTCKRGDWLVDNRGEVYTVDRETFEKTYQRVSPGIYRKTGHVWARRAQQPGSIRTKEGETQYAAGYYLVYNDPDGQDGYAMSPEKFHKLYRR